MIRALHALRNRVPLKKIIDASSVLLVNILLMLLGVVSSVIAARVLGPEGGGVLAVTLVWTALLSALAQVGLAQSLTYRVARNQGAWGEIFASAMALFAVQSLLILFIGWFTVALFYPREPEIVNAIRLYLFTCPLTLLLTYLSAIAQGLNQFGYFNMFRVLAALPYQAALIVAWLMQSSDLIYIFKLNLALLAGVGIFSLVLFILRVKPKGRPSLPEAKRLLSYGLRSYWGNLAWFTNARLDQFYISTILPMREVGYYAVAVSYASITFPVSGAISNILFPKAANRGKRAALEIIFQSLKINLLLCSALTLLLGAFIAWIFPAVFGEEYRAAIPSALILLVATFILGFNYILIDGHRGIEMPGRAGIFETLGLILTVAGLYFLVPRMGIYGAALTSLVSYGVVFSLLFRSMILLRKHPERLEQTSESEAETVDRSS